MAIFSAIGSAIAGIAGAVSTFIGGLGVVGSFLLKTAVGVGLNLLARAIAGKPQKGADFSTNGHLQGGGDVPRSLGVGYYATAGSLVYANTWGNAGQTNNAYLTQVIALSDMPIQSLAELWVNGEKVTIGTAAQGDLGFPIAEYAKNGTNHMWVKFHDGTQTTADPLLVNHVSGSNGRPYEATRVGRGIAYAVVTAFVGQESGLFQGFPSYKFGLIGMRLYDQTRDGSRGGTGSQRVGLTNTWGGDGDHLVAVQIANLLMGIRWNGQWQYGIQNLTVNRLPSTHWIQQIAKCRAPIAGPNGNEASFRAGGEIPYGAPLADAIEALLTAAYGRLAETGGFYKIHVGAPDAPVMAFTDGEIISTEEQSFTPFYGLGDTINGITARHPSPEEGWNVKPAPPIYNAGFEAEDGNRRLLADVPLDFVPYKGQVQRIMQAALREARRARRHTLTLPPEYWPVEPGDVVTWTSPRNGYVAKQFRVDGVVDRANLDVLVDITEIDPADYSWNQGTDYRVPVDGPVGPLRPAPMVIVDWSAVGDVVRDNAGNARGAAIRLSWDGSQPGTVGVEFQVRLAATGEVVHIGNTSVVQAGNILISHNIRPNVLYQVRGRYIPKSDVDSLWSGWLPVTTPDVRMGDFDVYLPGMVEEILDQAARMDEFATTGAREAIERIRMLRNDEAAEGAGNYLDRRTLRTETVLQIEETRAFVSSEINLAVGPGSAIVTRLDQQQAEITNGLAAAELFTITRVSEAEGALTTQLNTQRAEYMGGLAAAEQFTITRTNDLEGSLTGVLNDQRSEYMGGIAGATSLITTEVSRIDGVLVAEGNRIDTLVSELEGIESRFTMRAQVIAGPAGVSRWVVQVQTGTPGDYSTSSLILQTDAGGGSAGFIANRFFLLDITNQENAVQPFVFENGTARMNNALIANLGAGHINTASIAGDAGFLNSLVVTNAQILNGTLGADKLQLGVLLANDTVNLNQNPFNGTSPVVGQAYTDNPSGYPVFLYLQLFAGVSGGNLDSRLHIVVSRGYGDLADIGRFTLPGRTEQGGNFQFATPMVLCDPSAGAGSIWYNIRGEFSGPGSGYFSGRVTIVAHRR